MVALINSFSDLLLPAEFTFWRFTPLQANTAPLPEFEMAELAFASTPGGPNLLPSAVSVTAAGGVSVANLFDGSAATSANTLAGASRIPSNTAHVQAQFSTPVGVAEVRITKTASGADYTPILWALAGSMDGVAWIGRGIYSSTSYANGETKTFAIGAPQQNGGRAGSRVWIFQRNLGVGGRVRVRELAFATSAGGAQLAAGGLAISSQANVGIGTAANAFDGNTSSGEWASTSGAVLQWVGYYFPTPPNPTHYRVTGAAADYPSDWVVYYLSNCADWVAADTRSGQTGWVASETRTYTMSA